ncbi:diguanylate cyclase domain-containing protein [Nocardia takedensis]|uniref:GGDEF domain-containing protein n=1 Tax=Nocardia takedensis TaxID=259390 RepID=UPI00031424DD|nr:GGDEF domain-containing protein [Nocardia takedensis]
MTISAGQSAASPSPCGESRWCAVLLTAWTGLIALPLLLRSDTLTLGVMVAVVTGTLIMIGTGLRRHRPARPLPWYLLSASAVLFAVGTGLRDFTPNGAGMPWDDLCTLAGYFGVGVAAALWLRPRHVGRDHELMLDSALIGLAALLASWTFLISPILRTGATTAHTVLAAAYPVLDALLLTLIAHSVATANRSETSLRLVHLGLLAILVGDLGYSIDTAGTATIGHDLLLTPLLVAYASVGTAALHPTMASLGAPRRIHPHRSRQRAGVIAIALIVASLVPVVGAGLGLVDRVIVASLFALLLIGMLLRSERAIQRSARSERRAQYQADHDMLTGLLNRSALLRTLGRDAPGADAPIGLLFIDLDGFKLVNDSYGHAVGDELIAGAAARIRRVVRREDMVARYGGDEFVVAAPLERAEAATLAERLLGAFVRPFELSAGEVPITVSVGIACGGPLAGEDAVYALIRDADSAMYHAKQYSLGYAFPEDAHAPPPAPARPAEPERAAEPERSTVTPRPIRRETAV